MVGRKEETAELLSYVSSKRSEFIAVYGRRRVGKTYLVYETVGQHLSFYVTGRYKVSQSEQIENFYKELEKSGWKGIAPTTWSEAFDALASLLEKSKKTRKIIFIDEIPWMDAKRSSFKSALDHFWNSWAARRKDIVLIVCGSATTWMMSELVNNKGGLHNRLTHQIYVRPFNLAETEEMLKSNGIDWIRQQVVECYMVMGGIPYYLSLLKPNLSLAQNIDRQFFRLGGEMKTEFEKLYSSHFSNPDYYIKIVSALATKRSGMTRGELVSKVRVADGGHTTKALDDLISCNFIRRYSDYVHRKNDAVYQLIDPFTLFYYNFMNSGEFDNASDPWVEIQEKPRFNNWAGYAFEMVCLLHVPQIKKAFGISAVSTNVFAWRGRQDNEGAQIDLVIDRQDNIVNLCEIKFYSGEFSITKKYREELEKKRRLFMEDAKNIRPRKSSVLSFITSYGLKQNTYSTDIVATATMEDLF